MRNAHYYVLRWTSGCSLVAFHRMDGSYWRETGQSHALMNTERGLALEPSSTYMKSYDEILWSGIVWARASILFG